MSAIRNALCRLNEALGTFCGWLALFMVGVTFLIVIFRYVFGLSWIWLQDAVTVCHGLNFMLASAWALKRNAHVRVDIFYQKCGPRGRAIIDLLGSLLLALPTCSLIFYESLPYVSASWSVFEGARIGGGLGGIFLFKTAIPCFCVLTALQSMELALSSWEKLLEPRP